MKARGLLGVLVCAVALVGPATASGFTSTPLRYADIRVKASHGYHLRITAFDTNVNVEAENGDREVEYTVLDGSLRKDRIDARLPGVGWINLRFEERKRYRASPADNCEGPGDLIRVGTFEGRIRIKGEKGYTAYDRPKVAGKIEFSPEQSCSWRPARASAASDEALLIAAGPRGRGTLSFEANRVEPFAGFTPLLFHAGLFRQRQRMFISNSVEGFSEDAKLIEIGEKPLSAAVDPPGLFAGSAEFLQQAEDFTWLGDLTADLPGVGPVELAGPQFEAMLCLGRRCKGDKKLREAIGVRPLGRIKALGK
ncbi:MAG TPA: hypothetical protein VEP91_04065 [Solirubrobacterales bacterium]|nr:hypothetical protein [Solirubrobacterales bacterium]